MTTTKAPSPTLYRNEIEEQIADRVEAINTYRRASIESPEALARLEAAEAARHIEAVELPVLRDELRRAMDAERAATVDRWVDNQEARLTDLSKDVHDTLEAFRQATVNLGIAANALSLATNASSREAQGLIGNDENPRVSVGRVGVSIDRKHLRDQNLAVFSEAATIVAGLASALGAAGYADALNNVRRGIGGGTLHLPFLPEDTSKETHK
jgi:hypothetical protein